MKPIIIICGQDRTGKSTLVNQLANHFGPGAVKHHSGSPPKELEYPFNKIWEDNNYFSLMNVFNEVSKTNSVIVDRFHLGMPVFGKRFRKYPDSLHITELENYMSLGDNVFLILLTDESEELFKRDDGKSFEKSAEDFEETADQFKTEFDLSIIANKLHINITHNGGFVNTLPTILKFIKDRT